MPRGIYGHARHRAHSASNEVAPGSDFWGTPQVATVVGAGSVFGHTPGDVEDELNQINNEVMAFDAELVAYAARVNDVPPSPELQRLLDEQNQDSQLFDSTKPLRQQVSRIEKEMEETSDPSSLFIQLRDARLALDAAMPIDQRRALKDRLQSRAEQIWRLRDKSASRRDPELAAFETAWDAFKGQWMRFHSQKTSVPGQMLPFSGAWDRAQEYRKQFVDLVKRAPFDPLFTPLDPSDRKDPSITDKLGDLLNSIGGLTKVIIYGGLGLVGLVAVTSIVQQLRKGKDPLETYAAIARATRASSPTRGARRALPEGRP